MQRPRTARIYANTYFYEDNFKNEIWVEKPIILTEYYNEYRTLNLP